MQLSIINLIQEKFIVFLGILFAAAFLAGILFVFFGRRKKAETQDTVAETFSDNPDTFIPLRGETHADNIIKEKEQVTADEKEPETAPEKKPEMPQIAPENNLETKPAAGPEIKPSETETPLPPTEKKQPAVKPQKPFKDEDYEGESIEVVESKGKKNGTIEIYLDKKDKYRFRLKAANNEPVGHSESYNTKAACIKGIKSVVKYNETDIIDTTEDKEYEPVIGKSAYEIFLSSDSKFRFRLRAGNMKIILASQGYKSKSGCKNGIEAVKNVSSNYALKELKAE